MLSRNIVLGGFFAGLMLTSATASAQSDVNAAALRLKQAAVQRTWEWCQDSNLSEGRCKKLISAIYQEEKIVISDLAALASDPALDLERLSAEMAACYGSDYGELVNCQRRLVERVRLALQGETLLKK